MVGNKPDHGFHAVDTLHLPHKPPLHHERNDTLHHNLILSLTWSAHYVNDEGLQNREIHEHQL